MTKRLGLDFLEAKFEALSRELSLGGAGGTQLIGHRHVVETITASDSLTAADSGKVFLLDAADETAAVTITLPQLASGLVGVHYTLCITDASNGSFVIATGDETDSTGDMFIGYAMLGADQVGSTSNGAGGRLVVPAANDSNIVLDANLADSGGNAGTTVKLTAISATKWYVEAMIFTADADSDGTALFTNGS